MWFDMCRTLQLQARSQTLLLEWSHSMLSCRQHSIRYHARPFLATSLCRAEHRKEATAVESTHASHGALPRLQRPQGVFCVIVVLSLKTAGADCRDAIKLTSPGTPRPSSSLVWDLPTSSACRSPQTCRWWSSLTPATYGIDVCQFTQTPCKDSKHAGASHPVQ
jgi:hypothetical protein